MLELFAGRINVRISAGVDYSTVMLTFRVEQVEKYISRIPLLFFSDMKYLCKI